LPDIFSPESTLTELKKLDDLPQNDVHAGVVGKDGQVGFEAAGNVDLGSKGAFVEGEASWFKRTGWGFAAMIGWRKKP
jgi:hypothetical protein